MSELERLIARVDKQGYALLRLNDGFSSDFRIVKKHNEEMLAKGSLTELSYWIQGVEFGRRNVI